MSITGYSTQARAAANITARAPTSQTAPKYEVGRLGRQLTARPRASRPPLVRKGVPMVRLEAVLQRPDRHFVAEQLGLRRQPALTIQAIQQMLTDGDQIMNGSRQ